MNYNVDEELLCPAIILCDVSCGEYGQAVSALIKGKDIACEKEEATPHLIIVEPPPCYGQTKHLYLAQFHLPLNSEN